MAGADRVLAVVVLLEDGRERRGEVLSAEAFAALDDLRWEVGGYDDYAHRSGLAALPFEPGDPYADVRPVLAALDTLMAASVGA